MAKNIFALLVGINDYSANVGRLSGCLNDVDHFHDYLEDNFDHSRLHINVLKDGDATRPNIINQFRLHLGQATADDIAVFQYCGHGARCKSANAFKQFYPDGMDEGLVCFDSREEGGFDLADKELAVLLAELARNKPHIAVILDSCHSGSATRGADDFTQLRARQTHERYDERPLESYIDGYYAAQKSLGKSLEIPASRHILLAACERVQKAWEGNDHSGVFTSTLLEVLGKTGTDVSYADLFVRCRANVRKRADNQNPQFETNQGFNAYGGFLGGKASQNTSRYSVYFENNGWQVDCGALHGLPSDPDKKVELALYPESDQTHLAGHAATIQVGPQKSELQLDIEADASTRFQAEITSLPVPPLMIFLDGDFKGTEALQNFLAASDDRSFGFSFVADSALGTRYALSAKNDSYLLTLRETGKLIQGAKGYSNESADYMFAILKRVATWERSVALQNHSTKMNPDEVAFQFVEALGKDEEADKQARFESSEITIDVAKEKDEWHVVRGTLIANNRTQQPLHMLLVHFAEDYGVQTLYNERVEPTETEFTVTLDGNAFFNLALEDDEGDRAIHTFKLIVSTEKVDDFLIGQDPLELGGIFDPRGLRGTKGLTVGPKRKKLIHENEWFTKDLHVKLVRQLDHVTPKDTQLANRKITIKGHPSFQSNISLDAAKTTTRGVGTGPDIYRALEREGMELLNFSSTRGENASVLELTDIRNADALKDNPLEIELDVALKEGEFILPLAFDGDDILLIGNPLRDDEGRTRISIREFPDIPDNRRSLGRALKMYFFKAYLKQESVNQLCWIEYKPDGSFERHRSQVADKVAAAKNVLLLVHGIIGNTDSIVNGLKLAKGADGTSVDQKFDLVLTYDYENLSTPISETAVKLKEQLASVGLRENDEKRLTLLVHSMGGLVSRWFIEQEGGNKVVDHLVMFGTPNIGSPFGEVDSARQLSSMLTTLAIATFPGFTPFCGAMVYLLNRSKKVTPTLEQMNPNSEFIKTLNSSPDPGVPYTIVAGDIRDYKESADHIMARLVAKVGAGIVFDTLYQNAGHDIAVSDDSIRGIPDDRTPAPKKQSVICHHLNYFVADAGLKAMAAINW